MRPGYLRALSVSRITAVMAVFTVAGCSSAASKPSPGPSLAKASAAQVQVVSTALKYVGAPYARGGASPAGFDCSGFVMFVYGRVGVSLPHNAEKQYRLGAAVARNTLQPGDIVFFDGLGHSGIYIGEAKFVHATRPGDVVKVSHLTEDWYRRRWVGARRVL